MTSGCSPPVPFGKRSYVATELVVLCENAVEAARIALGRAGAHAFDG